MGGRELEARGVAQEHTVLEISQEAEVDDQRQPQPATIFQNRKLEAVVGANQKRRDERIAQARDRIENDARREQHTAAPRHERKNEPYAREEKGEALWQLGRKDEAVRVWSEAAAGNDNAVIINYMLAGAARSQANDDSFAQYEESAEASTPNDALFNWMIGMRLQNLEMNELAEKRFQRAIELNPEFKRARDLDIINRGR